MDKTREAIAYFHSLHSKDQKKIAIAAIERLIEMEEVSFRGRDVEYDGTIINSIDVAMRRGIMRQRSI